MYGGEYVTPEQIKAQQEAEKQRIKEKHDKELESQTDGGMGGPDRSKLDTHFMTMGIPKLRSMILDADPDRIYEVSQHWKSVHNILSGGDGDGKTGGVDSVSAKDSVAGMLQSHVENVLEHWEGEAAEAFRKKANEIMGNIRNGAAWANHMGETMHAAQNDLRNSMSKMRDVKEPSGWDRAWDKLTDDNRSDAQLIADINKGVSTDAARKANADSLSAGKEAQLQGVAIMEQLGVNYKAYANPGYLHDPKPGDPFPAPNPQTPMPTPIAMPTASSSRPSSGGGTPKPWSAGSTTSIKPTPTVPRDPGITGGSQLPTVPSAKTNVDSISPGLTGPSPSTGVGGPSVGGGSLGTGGAQSPGILAAGEGGLTAGAAGRGGIGATSGRGGLAGGGAAAGRGAGGRAGMGGMGGGGAGAAGRGGASAGGRGALARARGGVVGAAKGVGKGAGGGAGLHGSRGGTQAAGAGGVNGKGKRSREENSQGDRPDYLVEDEETWISEEDRNRNVPRTIE